MSKQKRKSDEISDDVDELADIMQNSGLFEKQSNTHKESKELSTEDRLKEMEKRIEKLESDSLLGRLVIKELARKIGDVSMVNKIIGNLFDIDLNEHLNEAKKIKREKENLIPPPYIN
jgi:predicted hydrolase (HD superfamily)